MELIVISNPVDIADENSLINNLFMAGLKCFHLRKPESDFRNIRELLNGIAPRFYDRIVLHQFHEMASDFGIKRLHYTELAREASTTAEWQSQLDDGFILTTSIHNITVLPELVHFDYAFYGPVFNSISKPGYPSKLPANFKLDKSNSKPNVIALGGVEVYNLALIKTMGFDGAAVLGTLWTDPEKAIERYHQLKENLPV